MSVAISATDRWVDAFVIVPPPDRSSTITIDHRFLPSIRSFIGPFRFPPFIGIASFRVVSLQFV